MRYESASRFYGMWCGFFHCASPSPFHYPIQHVCKCVLQTCRGMLNWEKDFPRASNCEKCHLRNGKQHRIHFICGGLIQQLSISVELVIKLLRFWIHLKNIFSKPDIARALQLRTTKLLSSPNFFLRITKLPDISKPSYVLHFIIL